MSEKQRAFLLPLGTGAAIAMLTFFLSGETEGGLVQRLCDCFFVPGMLITGISGLSYAKNEGMFDIFSFGIRTVANIHWPWVSPKPADEKKETFADYRIRKSKERKSPKGMLLAGLVYLGLAGIMLVIYLCR